MLTAGLFLGGLQPATGSAGIAQVVRPAGIAYHGNLSIESPGPGISVPAGTALTVVYELQDPGFSSADVGLYVHLPGSVAVFNTSGTTLRVPLTPKTVAITSTSWSSPGNTTFNLTLLNATAFPNSGPSDARRAVLSSQTVALTSPLPDGSWTVLVRWRWTLQPIVGQNQTGPWEPSVNGTPVRPAQSAVLSAATPSSLVPGGSFPICLSGLVANRTFSLRILQQNPTLLLTESDGTAPLGLLADFCLSAGVPSWVPPQTLLVQLWDQPNGSSNGSGPPGYLLFDFKVPVGPAAPTPPTLLGLPRTTAELLIGGLAAVTVVAAILLLRGRRSDARRGGGMVTGPPTPPTSRPPAAGPGPGTGSGPSR